MESLECDLLVLGAGMAGLSAAARAADAGARVVVVEKAPQIGGAAILSGGYVWTMPSRRQLATFDDGELGHLVVDNYAAAMAWLRRRGVEMSGPIPVVQGRGQQVDIVSHLRACESTVTATGGHVVVDTRVRRLLADASGRVVGALTSHADGEVEVRAPWTLLATGGYQASPELRAKYIHPRAAAFPLRAPPHSCGDGLRLAEEMGGTYAGPNPGFYGHLMAYPCALDDVSKFRALCQYQSDFSILLDRQGRRFCDEGLRDHRNANETAFLPEGRALLFWDQRVNEQHVLTPFVPSALTIDKLEVALAHGAQGALCATLEEVGTRASQWGFDGAQAVRTIREFNEAMRHGPVVLSPERTGETLPIDRAPFRILVVQPGVTFSQGGLWIDTAARALNTLGRPIPGLLVAGADAGNIYRRGYAGGLSLALTTGLQAAATAGFA